MLTILILYSKMRNTVILGFVVLFSVSGYCDDCQLPVDSGSCGDAVGKEELRYYYSAWNLKCTEFPYSGCGGNGNNYKSLEECKRQCGKPFSDLPLVANIIAAQTQSKCFYGNKTYAIREQIPEATTDSPCAMSCFCSNYRPGTPPRITCAAVDCQPYPDSDSEQDCVPVHKEGVCCPEYYCPSATETQKPHKCQYKGKEYVDGQTIYPDDYPCVTCTCNKNFKGILTTEGGVCKEVNCGMQIHHQTSLVKQCIPKFYTTSSGKQSCCPIEWNCNQRKS